VTERGQARQAQLGILGDGEGAGELEDLESHLDMPGRELGLQHFISQAPPIDHPGEAAVHLLLGGAGHAAQGLGLPT